MKGLNEHLQNNKEHDNREKEMAEAYSNLSRPMSKETHRALRAGNWALLATLLVLIGLLAKLFGIF